MAAAGSSGATFLGPSLNSRRRTQLGRALPAGKMLRAAGMSSRAGLSLRESDSSNAGRVTVRSPRSPLCCSKLTHGLPRCVSRVSCAGSRSWVADSDCRGPGEVLLCRHGQLGRRDAARHCMALQSSHGDAAMATPLPRTPPRPPLRHPLFPLSRCFRLKLTPAGLGLRRHGVGLRARTARHCEALGPRQGWQPAGVAAEPCHGPMDQC